MPFTDDPVADFNRHDREMQRAEREQRESRPRCVYCKKPILDDECYEFDFGCVCDNCIIDHHRKYLD